MSPPQGVEWNWSVYNPALVERQELIRRFLVTSRRDLLQELAGLLRGQDRSPAPKAATRGHYGVHEAAARLRSCSGSATSSRRIRQPLCRVAAARTPKGRTGFNSRTWVSLSSFVTLLDNLGDDDALRAKLLRESGAGRGAALRARSPRYAILR